MCVNYTKPSNTEWKKQQNYEDDKLDGNQFISDKLTKN